MQIQTCRKKAVVFSNQPQYITTFSCITTQLMIKARFPVDYNPIAATPNTLDPQQQTMEILKWKNEQSQQMPNEDE